MKVDASDPGWSGPLAGADQEERSASRSAESRVAQDRLEFSTRSRRLQSEDSSREARSERIRRLREAVAGGTYNVRAEALAEVLIRGALFDEKA